MFCTQPVKVLIEIPALKWHVLRQRPAPKVYGNFGLRTHQLFLVRVAVYSAAQRAALQGHVIQHALVRV